jgi:hypothetical protein
MDVQIIVSDGLYPEISSMEQQMWPALVKRQEEMRITIPENWYTVNGKCGYMFRKNNNFWGRWTAKDCYWFVRDKFEGYT